jgi:hypothetical protein
VKWGSRYRFRVINAASLDCPVQLQVEGHKFIIIASDGAPVKSTAASHLLLFPGIDHIIIITIIIIFIIQLNSLLLVCCINSQKIAKYISLT